MGYEVHVFRQPDSGAEAEITLAEWNKFIESDPDFTPPPAGNINYGKNLFLLPTDSSDPDSWPWIAWTSGRIHSKYCERPVMKKLGQMARAFGAVVMSDDGDIWTITEDGRVVVDSPGHAPATKSQPANEEVSFPPAIRWPYFSRAWESGPRPWVLRLQSCRSDGAIASAERSLADGLQFPLQEAAAALRTCQSGQPVGMPVVDLEEACSLAERLKEFGVGVIVTGVLNPPD